MMEAYYVMILCVLIIGVEAPGGRGGGGTGGRGGRGGRGGGYRPAGNGSVGNASNGGKNLPTWAVVLIVLGFVVGSIVGIAVYVYCSEKRDDYPSANLPNEVRLQKVVTVQKQY